jgi:hypothetical protein
MLFFFIKNEHAKKDTTIIRSRQQKQRYLIDNVKKIKINIQHITQLIKIRARNCSTSEIGRD